jgi:hypothetical protein
MGNKKLTEAEIKETFEIVKGFNIPDGDGEKRYEPGTPDKPMFVDPDDFDANVWKALVAGGAIQVVTKDDPTVPTAGEQVVFEVID